MVMFRGVDTCPILKSLFSNFWVTQYIVGCPGVNMEQPYESYFFLQMTTKKQRTGL